MRDKERIVLFLQKLIPDDFICGHIAVTFNDDGSLFITVSNREDEQEAVVHPEISCEMKYITDCCCDLCGVQLIREDNFCRGCGKPIDWSK